MQTKEAIHATCKCGQPFLIERTLQTCRSDGKRVYYSDQDDKGLCAFLCRACLAPVHESVPGAEFEDTPEARKQVIARRLASAEQLDKPDAQAMVAITVDGFVDGACWADGEARQAEWIMQMRKEGFGVVKVDRPMAKAYLFETIPLDGSEPGPNDYGRMIVARRKTGEVEAAGWDCAGARESAKEWLGRGLGLEFVALEQVQRLAKLGATVFETLTPVGEVLSAKQAKQALAGY